MLRKIQAGSRRAWLTRVSVFWEIITRQSIPGPYPHMHCCDCERGSCFCTSSLDVRPVELAQLSQPRWHNADTQNTFQFVVFDLAVTLKSLRGHVQASLCRILQKRLRLRTLSVLLLFLLFFSPLVPAGFSEAGAVFLLVRAAPAGAPAGPDPAGLPQGPGAAAAP